ncbi:MAG TPA: hypothetical protein VHZ51_28330 [Ktedonobacteraceae bacterium]|nr:hypothetical protein [Ktedonobacteraceae bacterium]
MLDQQDAEAYFGKSEAWYHLQAYEDALATCEQAIKIAAHHGHFYTQQAEILDQLSREANNTAKLLVANVY